MFFTFRSWWFTKKTCFACSGSPYKCACNCKRIRERTGLDINYANFVPSAILWACKIPI